LNSARGWPGWVQRVLGGRLARRVSGLMPINAFPVSSVEVVLCWLMSWPVHFEQNFQVARQNLQMVQQLKPFQFSHCFGRQLVT